MLKRFTEDLPSPTLEDGEVILRQGVGALGKPRWGPLVLTNRRLLWSGRRRILLPWRRNSVEVRLSEIRSIDKGNLFNLIFGGMRIRLRLKSGKLETLYEGDGKLDEWIAAIRQAMAQHQENNIRLEA